MLRSPLHLPHGHASARIHPAARVRLSLLHTRMLPKDVSAIIVASRTSFRVGFGIFCHEHRWISAVEEERNGGFRDIPGIGKNFH